MQSIKYCAICGIEIAREEETDYYRYIRLKYCRTCAKTAHEIQNARYMSERRKTARERIALCGEINDELKNENALLRAELIRLRSEVRKLKGL